MIPHRKQEYTAKLSSCHHQRELRKQTKVPCAFQPQQSTSGLLTQISPDAGHCSTTHRARHGHSQVHQVHGIRKMCRTRGAPTVTHQLAHVPRVAQRLQRTQTGHHLVGVPHQRSNGTHCCCNCTNSAQRTTPPAPLRASATPSRLRDNKRSWLASAAAAAARARSRSASAAAAAARCRSRSASATATCRCRSAAAAAATSTSVKNASSWCALCRVVNIINGNTTTKPP